MNRLWECRFCAGSQVLLSIYWDRIYGPWRRASALSVSALHLPSALSGLGSCAHRESHSARQIHSALINERIRQSTWVFAGWLKQSSHRSWTTPAALSYMTLSCSGAFFCCVAAQTAHQEARLDMWFYRNPPQSAARWRHDQLFCFISQGLLHMQRKILLNLQKIDKGKCESTHVCIHHVVIFDSTLRTDQVFSSAPPLLSLWTLESHAQWLIC